LTVRTYTRQPTRDDATRRLGGILDELTRAARSVAADARVRVKPYSSRLLYLLSGKGFQAEQWVEVRVGDRAAATQMLRRAAGVCARQTCSRLVVQKEVTQDPAVLTAARTDAARDAREKARALAAAAGVRIGDPVYVHESSARFPDPRNIGQAVIDAKAVAALVAKLDAEPIDGPYEIVTLDVRFEILR
jgi:uncharacterized protein YggE